MKKGILTVNGFLRNQKFSEIYDFFLNNAAKFDFEISIVGSDSLIVENYNSFADLKDLSFVVFWDKDVCLAKRMEQCGLRLFNNARAVEICDSKTLTSLALRGKIPMPPTIYSPKTFPGVGYNNFDFLQNASDILGFPLVIKESYGSFGQQVYLAKTFEQAKNIVSEIAGKDFVLQKFISESCGRDIRLNVVGGKVVNAILRSSQTDFRSNLTLGGKSQKYTPSEAEIRIAEEACRLIGLDFAGVDVLFGEDGPLLCEVNSNPHFKTTFDCTGEDLSQNILKHIADCIG